MNNKSIFVLVFVVLLAALIPLVLANGAHNTSHEEDTSIGHQFEEILPFHHFAEGHIFAGIMIILFWMSFFYMLYSIFQMLRKKK
mgnify:CR=1 FL=1